MPALVRHRGLEPRTYNLMVVALPAELMAVCGAHTNAGSITTQYPLIFLYISTVLFVFEFLTQRNTVRQQRPSNIEIVRCHFVHQPGVNTDVVNLAVFL
jgi:hypothetical protein